MTEAQTSAEGSEGGEDDASDGESEDADADPAPETAPETEEPHVVYEFTEEAYELEMAAAQETAQAMEKAGASSEQAAAGSEEESSSQAAEAASAEPEVTAADLAEALGTVLASENEDVAIAEETEIPDETEREEETDSSAESSTMEEAETPEETSTSEEVPVSEEEPETVSDSEESIVEEPETVTITPEELDEMIEEAETQDTYDEESGWTVTGVIQWATEEEEIDLAALGFGESVSFEIPRKTRLKAASKSTQTVDITRGNRYSYSDYGLGSYVTFSYTVKFGDVKATAYCVQPSRSSPGDGTFTITKLKDGKALAKVCYYGTKASGDEGFFAEKHPDFSAGKRFIITHMAAAYANGSSDAFSGTNETGKKLAMDLYNYCQDMPNIPDVDMAFSEDTLQAYVEGSSQRTKVVTFDADELQTITFKLPAGVKLHNETTKDYSAYKITTGSDTQDLALVFGEAVDKEEKYVEIDVTWVQKSRLTVVKTDAAGKRKLSGAVFGVYSDKACTNLLVKMPATDANGSSTVELDVTGTVYLKELTPPKRYRTKITSEGVTVSAGTTATKTIPNDEIRPDRSSV